MKKFLWMSLSLAMTIGMVACGDDSSSGGSGFSVPEYKSEAALPDSCEMEVAKAGDTYFACFENKWIEVTDSATVEQLKEGLDENEIKEKLEELEDLLKPSAPSKPKSSSSGKTDEIVESNDSEEPESSSDEEECSGKRCKDSSSSAEEDFLSSSSEQQGDEDADKCSGKTYDPATQYCQNGTTIADLATCGTAKYKPEEKYCTKDGEVANLVTCGAVKYNPEEKFCADEIYDNVADLCDGKSYDVGKFEVCVSGAVKQYECCGYDGSDLQTFMACISEIETSTFENLYDPATQYCQDGSTIADLATCDTVRYNPTTQYCTKHGNVADLATCGTAKYNPEEKFCADEYLSSVFDLCDGKSYDVGKFEACVSGAVKQYECCGYDGSDLQTFMACISEIETGTFEHLYDPATQYCQNGTTVGDLVSCGTYDPATQFCDPRAPGNIYKYVTIGSQTWMAENLNFEAIEGSYCYDDESANCVSYGRLYTWAAAVGKSEEECGYGMRCNFTDTVQGICPEGWHLPSDNEWQTLLTAVNSAAKLKANTGWSNDGNGTDDYGFAVKPAGYMSGWYYTGEMENASFWTSTADGVNDGYRVLFSYESNDAEVWYKDKGLGYSVRCVKNAN